MDRSTRTDKAEVIPHGEDAVLPSGTDPCDPGVALKRAWRGTTEAVDAQLIGAFEDDQLILPTE